jgi:hypothetical protein
LKKIFFDDFWVLPKQKEGSSVTGINYKASAFITGEDFFEVAREFLFAKGEFLTLFCCGMFVRYTECVPIISRELHYLTSSRCEIRTGQNKNISLNVKILTAVVNLRVTRIFSLYI